MDGFTWITSFVIGSVMTLRSSGASSPGRSLKLVTSRWDSRVMNPLATSRGNRTRTDSQLKQSWIVAPAKALSWITIIFRVSYPRAPPVSSTTQSDCLLISFSLLWCNEYFHFDVCICAYYERLINYIYFSRNRLTCHLFGAVVTGMGLVWTGAIIIVWSRCCSCRCFLIILLYFLLCSLNTFSSFSLHLTTYPLHFSISVSSSLNLPLPSISALLLGPAMFSHSPLKLGSLCCLHHGHYGVCDWSPNIRPHDDWNSRPHF